MGETSRFLTATFVIYRDAKGEFRWTLRGRNWETMADSGEGYVSKSGCEAAVARVKAQVPSATVLDMVK